jgi:hypothetical protein
MSLEPSCSCGNPEEIADKNEFFKIIKYFHFVGF